MTAMASRSSTRLLFLRHGESRSNRERWFSSLATCGGLTDQGRAEAAALRDRLAAEPSSRPDLVFSSTMLRAVQTAAIVTEPLGIEVVALEDLCERHPGECEGMTHAEYESHYGRLPYDDWAEPFSPGGESFAEFDDRVRRARQAVADQAAGRTAWVVCHGGIVISTARQLGGEQLRWSNPANAAICEWASHDGSAWRLVRYNDHGHLVP